MRVSTVPTRPVTRPGRPQAGVGEEAVVVLPLVPVTPSTQQALVGMAVHLRPPGLRAPTAGPSTTSAGSPAARTSARPLAVREDGNRSPARGLGREARAVGVRTGKGGVEVTRHDRP